MSTFKLLIVATLVALASGHGYLKEPIARSSIQHRPEFGTEGPFYWDHQAVWCGNVQQDTNYSTCGRCGDVAGETHFNQGGMYDTPVIVATYQAGTVVEMVTEYIAAHFGHMELELCPQEQETDDCFQKLPIFDASEEVLSGNRVCVPHDNSVVVTVRAQVQLPAGVRCERCTIRWTYRTSYPGSPDWDVCDNPEPAQTFRNCANVKII